MLFVSQDQYDHIDKHTQSGLDLLERYIKFVKERTEIEQSYAKQLRCAFSFCELVFGSILHLLQSVYVFVLHVCM